MEAIVPITTGTATDRGVCQDFMRWIDSAIAVGTCQLAKIPMGPDPIGTSVSIGTAATNRAAASKVHQGVRDVYYGKAQRNEKRTEAITTAMSMN
jgi:hypothetical protein